MRKMVFVETKPKKTQMVVKKAKVEKQLSKFGSIKPSKTNTKPHVNKHPVVKTNVKLFSQIVKAPPVVKPSPNVKSFSKIVKKPPKFLTQFPKLPSNQRLSHPFIVKAFLPKADKSQTYQQFWKKATTDKKRK